MVILWIVVLIVGLIIYKYLTAIDKDKKELKTELLKDKFWYLINDLNYLAFDGDGVIIEKDSRTVVIAVQGANQIIELFYATGHLDIIWMMKIEDNQDVIYKKTHNYVRELDATAQKEIARETINFVESYFDLHAGDIGNCYKKVNRSGFTYKITNASVSKLKTLFYQSSSDNRLDPDLDNEVDIDDDEDFETKKSFIVADNNNTSVMEAINFFKSIELFIILIRPSFLEDNTLEITKDGKLLLYRDDKKERLEFIKSEGSDVELFWTYENEIYGQTTYNTVLEDLLDIVRNQPNYLILLAMKVRNESWDKLGKSYLSSYR